MLGEGQSRVAVFALQGVTRTVCHAMLADEARGTDCVWPGVGQAFQGKNVLAGTIKDVLQEKALGMPALGGAEE